MVNKTEQIQRSATVLGNATEMATRIIRAVAGNDIADSIGGSKITANTVRSLVLSRFKRNLETIK